jgi:hypothetical protein
MKRRIPLLATMLGALVMFGGAGVAQANEHDCRQAERYELRLNRDVARHGYDSWQARHDRRVLEHERWACRAR